ncbi:hypothetical protein Peur_029435 [Populus x canadensis]
MKGSTWPLPKSQTVLRLLPTGLITAAIAHAFALFVVVSVGATISNQKATFHIKVTKKKKPSRSPKGRPSSLDLGFSLGGLHF